jgi:hypothetical protein
MSGQTGGVEHRLDGGNAGGAVRVGDTVRKAAGPWTPAVHELLRHLASKGFAGAPRPLGIDDRGREILTFLDGETVGSARPWPGRLHRLRFQATAAAAVPVRVWLGESAEAFLAVVRARLAALVTNLRELAVTGDPLFAQIVAQGADAHLETALARLHEVLGVK